MFLIMFVTVGFASFYSSCSDGWITVWLHGMPVFWQISWYWIFFLIYSLLSQKVAARNVGDLKKFFLTFYVPYDTTMFSFIFIESKRKSSTYRKKMEAEVWLWKKRTELNLKWNQMKYNKENRRYSLYDRQNDGLSKWLQRKEVKRQINDLKFKNCNNRPCLWQINYKWF